MTSALVDGKIALITGAARGIGWATARELAHNGAALVLTGRGDQQRLEHAASQIRDEFGTECIGFVSDVTRPSEVSDCYQAVFKKFRRLDVLVNNAGILEDALLGMISEELLLHVFQVNALGALRHLQGASRLMGRSKNGSIINVSSIVGVRGNEGQAAYAASKAAIIGMTLAAAKELAPKNIRVNAVAPGFIDTDMTRRLPPDIFQERLKSIKMGRIGTPEDVAKTILFLASDLSSYVTGQVIGVDGGMLV